MLKNVTAALLAGLVCGPASAATFTYVGAPFTNPGTTGFKNVVIRFVVPGPIQANQTYYISKFTGYTDGLNRLAQLVSYQTKGRAFGGNFDSFISGTVSTDAHAMPVSWTFQTIIGYQDSLGNEGYDLYVNGPGNSATCPSCGFDSLNTTLPETLPVTESMTSAKFGTLTYKN